MSHLLFEADEIEKMIIPHLLQIGHLNIERFNRIAEIYRRENLAPKNTSLRGISYKEYTAASKQLPSWAIWLFFVAAITSLLIILLFLINRRLNRTIILRTQDLQNSNARLAHYLNIINQQVITAIFNNNGIIEEVSDAFCTISHYVKEELIGQPYTIIQHPDADKDEQNHIINHIQREGFWRGESIKIAKNHTTFWLQSNIQMTTDNDNTQYTAICTDITDKKRIEQLSITDKLTKIYNRLKLDYSLTYEMYRSDRALQPLSVLLIDIDNFKSINDKYGHLTGDSVLIHIAQTLQKSVRSLDILGRWGGEEFLIICPNTTIDGAKKLAGKLLRTIATQDIVDDLTVTASIGVANHRTGEQNDDFIKRADEALYSAKNNGRNRLEIETALLLDDEPIHSSSTSHEKPAKH